MEYFAVAMTKSYNNITMLPHWVLYIITGALGSLVIGLLHRSSNTPVKANPKLEPKAAVKEQVSPPATATATASAAGSSNATKRGGTKTKKGGKK
jgi:hypothetical protein